MDVSAIFEIVAKSQWAEVKRAKTNRAARQMENKSIEVDVSGNQIIQSLTIRLHAQGDCIQGACVD